jgi:serine/threonine protein phosphatase PrpC
MNTVLNKLEIGHSSIQGYRPHMEDQYVAQLLDGLEDHVLVAVMDGHAGPGAAQFTSRRLSSIIGQTEQFRRYVSMDVAARASLAGVELLSAALIQAYVDMDAEYECYQLRVSITPRLSPSLLVLQSYS